MVNIFILVNIREIYIRGFIELKEIVGGRVIVDLVLILFFFVVVEDVIISGKIEICIVGKCRRGGV